jgi:hypothetical protein
MTKVVGVFVRFAAYFTNKWFCGSVQATASNNDFTGMPVGYGTEQGGIMFGARCKTKAVMSTR